MGIIQVAGPQTGKRYRVNIAGQTPTPEEQFKIDNFVNSQERAAINYLQSYGVGLGQQQSVVTQSPQEIDRTAFGRGFERQGFGLGPRFQRGLGISMETLGGEFGWDGIEEKGREKKEAAEEELARLEAEDPSVRFTDIEGVDTAASFAGEAIGEEVGDLAIQTGATGTGFLFGGPAGALIGRTLGVGYTTIKSLPEMFAENVEAQERAGKELNLIAATGTTVAQAGAEFLADFFIVGKLLPQKQKGRMVRALTGGVEASGVEGATEVLQQMATRAQAGLPMFDEEARLEYAEAFAAGAVVGGTFGTSLGALSPEDKSITGNPKSEKELEDDIAADILLNNQRFKFAEDTEAETVGTNLFEESERNLANTEAVERGLPSPEKPAGLLPNPTTVSPLEFDQKSYDKSVFQRILAQIQDDKEVNITSILQKAKKENLANLGAIPDLTRKQVVDVIEELKTRGIVADNPSSKGGKYILMGAIAPTLDNLDVRLRRTIDSATANIKTLEKKLGILNNITRPTVLRTGFDLKGKKATAKSIEAEIAATETNIQSQRKMIEVAQQRLGQQHVPSIERVGIPNNMKKVPIGEINEDNPRLVQRFESQKRLLEEYKTQAAGIKKALARLNRIAKKRNLSSNEAEKFARLQTAYAEASQRSAEIKANLKTPKEIVDAIKAEQQQEARDLKELDLRVKAAEAKALDSSVQETQRAREEADTALDQPRVSAFTSVFNDKQASVFTRLRQRLSGYNLKDIKLEGTQKLEGAEGSYNPMSRVISLAMGMYDPNMTDDQLFDAVAEVMDHEMIHALKDIGVMTPKEASILEKAAGNTKYVKRNTDGTFQTRSYTYLDRAKRMYPEDSDTVQREEAVAEMFRDFNAGRLKSSGAPRGIYNKVKNFFKKLISTLTGSGFNNVESIFKAIQSGEVGARERPVQESSNELNEIKQPKKSKLVTRLTDEQYNASILPYLNPNTGQPVFKSKPGSNTLVSLANKIKERRGTREYDIINSEQDREEVSQIMAAEAEAALLSSRDALGWYDATLKLAKKVLYSAYPEISPERPDGTPNPRHDPEAEFAFDYATAVTSNGLAVIKNYEFASEQYDAFVKTGKFPLEGTGDQGKSMIAAFEFWNAMVDNGMTVAEINDLLMQQIRRGELNQLLTQVFGVDKVQDLPKGVKADSKEEADTMVSVAYAIGPKIGNGFLQNLRGNFDPLTMDRWWMRFVNRITGKPLVEFSDQLIEDNVDRVWNRVSNLKQLDDVEKGMLEDATRELNIVRLEKSDIELLAPELMKQWNKRFNKAYNDKLKSLLEEMDFTINGSRVEGRDAKAAKERARLARPEKPELALAASSLADKLKPKLQEDPRGGPDRTAMRDVANRAREILRQNNQIAADLTNADFQALMWYAEKRIFEAGGVRKGQGDDNDYADGAIALLKKKGVPDDAIKNSLPDSERRRVDSGKPELEGDQETGSIPVEKIQEPKEGDFFSAREVEILSEEEFVDVNPEEKGIKGVPSPVRLSVLPTEKQRYQPVFSPVKDADGKLGIAYGKYMFGGELLSVFLPMGSHTVYESGHEVGNGLYHIQQRLHDKELVENSKYKRVENAIFDILRKWKDQGYDDGESVISYPSRDGIVLEWKENLGFSAPPLRLVLEYGGDVTKPFPMLIKNAFYVHNFYPLIEKKKRAVPQKTGVDVRNETLAEAPKMLSKLMSDTPLSQATPNFGPSDLEQTIQNLRYAGVQESIASGLSKLGKPFNVDKEKIDAGTTWLFTKMQDDFLPVAKMYDNLRAKGAQISRDMDAYFQELLMHGVQGPKKEKFQETEFTPILELVAGIDVNSREEASLVSEYYKTIKEKTENSGHALANSYLYALHAKERNQRISELSDGKIKNGSGMSDVEADNIIRFVQSLDQRRRSSLESIAQQTRDIISGTNDVYIEGDLIPDYKDDEDIDDSTRQAFTKYKNYVPLRGFADSEMELDLTTNQNSFTGASGDRFGGSGNPNRKALGRASPAGDILANVAVQRQAAIDKAEKNKVGVAFLNLLQEEGIDTTDFAYIYDTHPIKRVMRNGRISHMPDRDFHNPNQPVLAVRKGGVEYLIGFYDHRIANAFKGQSTRQANKFVGAMHSLVRVYANMLTSWNPAFLFGNAPRDIETALFNSQQYNMKGSSKDIMKGVYPAGRAILAASIGSDGGKPYWRNRYKQFYENGGQNVLNQMGSDIDNHKDIKKTIERIVEADSKGQKTVVKALMTGVGKKGASLVGGVEALNSAVENGIRLSFFDAVAKNLEAQGVPEKTALREAAAAARQLTTNFAKGGQTKTFWNSFYLFYNASLQGSMAMINATVNSKKARKILGGVVVMGFLMDQLNAAFSGDEDEDEYLDYDNIGEYKLAHSIILPDMNQDGVFQTIPMAYGLNMFYNAGRSMSALLRGKYTVGQAVSSTLGTAVGTLNPFGGNNPLTFVAPTILDPAVELLTNKNFMDGPIYKELSPFEQYKSRSALHWETTSPTAIAIAKFVNDTIGGGTDIIPGEVLGQRVDMNPDTIEHVMDFLLGGAGKFVIQMGEATTTGIPAFLNGEWEKDMIRRTPIINKVRTAVTEKDRAGDFFEKRDDILAVDAELRDARDSGDRERALAVISRYPELIRLIKPIKNINSKLRKLNKAKRAVIKNENLSDKVRKQRLEKIAEARSKLISTANRLMENI